MERFELYNGETLVASFSHERTLLGDVYNDISVHTIEQLPIRLKKSCTDRAFDNWINRRSVPVNRHHMEAMLGALNLEKPFDLMRYSHGSLPPWGCFQSIGSAWVQRILFYVRVAPTGMPMRGLSHTTRLRHISSQSTLACERFRTT